MTPHAPVLTSPYAPVLSSPSTLTPYNPEATSTTGPVIPSQYFAETWPHERYSENYRDTMSSAERAPLFPFGLIQWVHKDSPTLAKYGALVPAAKDRNNSDKLGLVYIAPTGDKPEKFYVACRGCCKAFSCPHMSPKPSSNGEPKVAHVFCFKTKAGDDWPAGCRGILPLTLHKFLHENFHAVVRIRQQLHSHHPAHITKPIPTHPTSPTTPYSTHPPHFPTLPTLPIFHLPTHPSQYEESKDLYRKDADKVTVARR